MPSMFMSFPEDVECRLVHPEQPGQLGPAKKICTEVPTQKCVPVPVKVEAEECVNIPTQSCQVLCQVPQD